MEIWDIVIALAVLIQLALLVFLIRKKGTGQEDELFLSRLQNLVLGQQQQLIQPVTQSSEKVVERLGETQRLQLQSLNEFKEKLLAEERANFEKLGETLERRLDKMDQKVQEGLHSGLEKTNKSFLDLMERLAKIDEAQKKIEALSSNVVSLQDVLTDKKSRGLFGEVQLKNLLENVFGENQRSVYQLQAGLGNGTIVDALLTLPEPVGKVAIDSKFPLENYKRMTDRTQSDEHRNRATKSFVQDLKKHIDDIAGKYIVKNETSDQAILFLPAEAIFAEIHAYHGSLVEYAQKKRVWLTSPTTFMATLTSLQTLLTHIERSKHMKVIHTELNKLGDDFRRFEDRWDDLARHIDTVSKDVSLIHTSSQKISGRFKKILDVDLEQRIEE